jgi:hypothetical protein
LPRLWQQPEDRSGRADPLPGCLRRLHARAARHLYHPRSRRDLRDPQPEHEPYRPGAEDRRISEYQATPSIQRYVILEQTHAGAQVFSRRGADWIVETAKDDDILRLPEIGIEIPLAEIYADVALVEDEEAGT